MNLLGNLGAGVLLVLRLLRNRTLKPGPRIYWPSKMGGLVFATGLVQQAGLIAAARN